MEAFQSHLSVTSEIAAAPAAVTALIIDDDRHVRSYLRMVLRLIGVTTVGEAASAADAMALCVAQHPTLVMLAVDLPDGGGEAIGRLLAIDAQTTVVAITPGTDAGDANHWAQLGAIASVPVGIVREEIAQRISAVLSHVETEERSGCRMVA
jgi:DNA-binding NarL/FixJ family response regulator